MKTLLLPICVILILQSSAQDRNVPDKKISPSLLQLRNTLNNDHQQRFFIVANDFRKLKQLLAEKNLQQHIVSEYEPSNLITVNISRKWIDSLFLPSRLVKFIDIVRMPKEEKALDGFDLSTNQVNLVHSEVGANNGEGVVVSVKENKPDTSDIDLKGRLIQTRGASPNTTAHATIMATIIAGGGNSHHNAKGVAWGADITSSDFAGLLPDADVYYRQNNISVQNHSYGTGIENYYGADAAAYDASTISNPALLHVFSSGNSGDKSGITGAYTGIAGYANLTGSFKMAKNIITVGATDSFYNVSPLSSRGPAYDGRIRPELVAFGLDGTSGAAAIVSGTALLLQQAYKEKTGGQSAPAPLIKAILLNTADDVGPAGIDYQAGYGSLNAYKAIQGVINNRYFSNTISQSQVQSFSVIIPSNVHQLKITVCWNDVPANPNNSRALINDLDLRLVHQASGTTWQPWVLNSFPHRDSLSQLPLREKDKLNNTEQITLDNPLPGSYTIEVEGYDISSGPQAYHISYHWDPVNQFRWQYPTKTDFVSGGSTNTLRWTSTFNSLSGKLYYSSDKGNTWKLIAENINLDRKYFQWLAPDTFSTVLFRMQVNSQNFISDTSTISASLTTAVGFNCVDSFLIYWNKAPGVSSYTFYQLGEKYLEPVSDITDTSIILRKLMNTPLYYAVSPKIETRSGLRSYAFNYNTQGVGCYIKDFLADLNAERGNIRLEFGTVYSVKDIVVEKWSRNKFISWKAISPGTSLQYNFTDDSLLTGRNIYRIKINLKNGQTVYSNTESIFYFANMNYVVYPNPAKMSFQVASKDIDKAELILYNMQGQKIVVQKLNSSIQNIAVPQLKPGLYFFHVLEKGKNVYQGNIVIQ